MTSFPILTCTPSLSQGGDKWHKERAPYATWTPSSSPTLFMDLKAQTYTTWPKNTRPKFILLGPNTRPKLF